MQRLSAIRNELLALRALRVLAATALVAGIAPRALAQDDEVATAHIERTVEIAAAVDKDAADRVIAEIAAGSIELVVDPSRDAAHVEAEFTVDGRDDKDVKRRSELVKIYAARAADQTVVVQPMFPGKAMARDSVRVRIVIPRCGDLSLKSTTGSITTTGTAGKMKVNTKNGAVKVTTHAGSLEVHAGDGAVDIVGAGAEVRVSAANGAVSVALADGNDLPFEVETRNGTARVEVGAQFDGIVKMHSTSGSIDVTDPARRGKSPQSSDHSKTIELGAASAHSEIRTTSGAVRLAVRAK